MNENNHTHITEEDLKELGFTLGQKALTYSMWGGHRMRIRHSEKSIQIVMQGCACNIFETHLYTREQMEALLFGTKPIFYKKIKRINMINKVTLIGRLGKDAELKTLENGVQYCHFSVATDQTWKDEKGDWQKATTWHNITVWRDMATRYGALKKGDLVFVEGSLEDRSYIDGNGNKQYRYGVNGSIVRHLDKKALAPPEPVPPPQYSYDSAAEAVNTSPSKIQSDDELPF